MPSTINSNLLRGPRVRVADLRANFDAAKTEIEQLQGGGNATSIISLPVDASTAGANKVLKINTAGTGHEYGDASGITIDSALSDTSTNPVQNRVIKAAIDGKAAVDHTQSIDTITGLQDALNGKEATGVAAGLVSGHTGAGTGAHAATAVSVDPTGLLNLASTDINAQLAVAALDAALGNAEAALASINNTMLVILNGVTP